MSIIIAKSQYTLTHAPTKEKLESIIFDDALVTSSVYHPNIKGIHVDIQSIDQGIIKHLYSEREMFKFNYKIEDSMLHIEYYN